MAKTDQWDHMFETMVTITVATDMMGHVRVTGTLEDTGEVRQTELLVQDDDPAVVREKVVVAVRDIYKALDGD
jgi:hypothetical protein